MRDIPLTAVTLETLRTLMESGATEDRDLDFKRELYKPNKHKDLCTDLSAFANTVGGDLILGAEEERDADGNKTGRIKELVGVPAEGLEDVLQTYENVLRNGVDPRLPPVQFHVVPGGTIGPCVVARIPRSWIGPHMVKDSGRFSMRNTKGNFPLDARQVRAAFLESEAPLTRARRFRHDRIREILAGESLVGQYEGPLWCLHVIPLDGIQDAERDIVTGNKRLREDLRIPLDEFHGSGRYNADGFVRQLNPKTLGQPAYSLAFRNGTIEAVDGVAVSRRMLASHSFEQSLVRVTRNFVATLRAAGVDSRLLVATSLLWVQGFRMGVSREDVAGRDLEQRAIDRDHVFPPDVLVDEEPVTGELLKPVLDVIWQAAGWEGSRNFDAAGKWQLQA